MVAEDKPRLAAEQDVRRVFDTSEKRGLPGFEQAAWEKVSNSCAPGRSIAVIMMDLPFDRTQPAMVFGGG